MTEAMTPHSLQASAPAPAGAPEPARADEAIARAAPMRPKRTLGLWLVDTLIYPIVNNFGVFGISVFATYLTQHGWPQPANGKALAGWKHWIGEAFQSRGKRLDSFLMNKLNASAKTAEMSRMVFFSFADGTFVAPFVKLLEDRREKMAIAIDSALGTKPADESAYEAEPKQSWRSVIEGRILTSLIVVPTAALLGRKNVTGQSLNDFLFNNPGEKRGEQIQHTMPKLKAGIEKLFGKVHLPFFAKTVYFEAFYTSVCTAGLYFISRFFARKHPKQEKPRETPRAAHAPSAADSPSHEESTEKTPTTTIRQPQHADRVSSAGVATQLTA